MEATKVVVSIGLEVSWVAGGSINKREPAFNRPLSVCFSELARMFRLIHLRSVKCLDILMDDTAVWEVASLETQSAGIRDR